MAVTDLPRLVRNAGRFNEVIAVALKYGIAPWLSNVQADWVQRHLRSDDGQKIGELSEPVRVRMALTELGTTFIKLGQQFDVNDGRLLAVSMVQSTEGINILPQGEVDVRQYTKVKFSTEK